MISHLPLKLVPRRGMRAVGPHGLEPEVSQNKSATFTAHTADSFFATPAGLQTTRHRRPHHPTDKGPPRLFHSPLLGWSQDLWGIMPIYPLSPPAPTRPRPTPDRSVVFGEPDAAQPPTSKLHSSGGNPYARETQLMGDHRSHSAVVPVSRTPQ